jgi:hypothetical protein
MLNGQSRGWARSWEDEEGDYLVARITEVDIVNVRYREQTHRLGLLVDEGTERGKRLEPDTHRTLFCSKADLARMARIYDPQPGDTLALANLGREKRRHGAGLTQNPRHLYRYSVEKSARIQG